jgi:hypothetical protein
MIVLKPPQHIALAAGYNTVFLAGTIDMGTSIDWQADVATKLADIDKLCLLNPLRAIFDASMVQSINNPDFAEQVNWELDALDYADIILMNFVAGSKSPISLLELGLYARTGKMIVCCPNGFWRKGNVDIVCDKFKVPVVTTMDHALELVRNRLTYFSFT